MLDLATSAEITFGDWALGTSDQRRYLRHGSPQVWLAFTACASGHSLFEILLGHLPGQFRAAFALVAHEDQIARLEKLDRCRFDPHLHRGPAWAHGVRPGHLSPDN
jgi:hypothetical protein